MGIKLFGAGGIDQKSNDLLRDPKNLRDSRNVMINIRNEYCKRNGTDTNAGFNSEDFNDTQHIKALDTYFFWNGTDYVTYKNTVKKIPFTWSKGTETGVVNNISLAEYLNTTIFTHDSNQVSTMKYDGQSIYKAGLPAPLVTTATSGTLYILYFYEYIDAQGNTIYGPATILKNKASVGSFTVPTFLNSGFYGGFLQVPFSAGINQSLTDSNLASRTLLYDSISPDISYVGARVTFKSSIASGVLVSPPGSGTASYFIQLEIESINTTTKEIVFTADSFKGSSIIMGHTNTGVFNVLGSLSIRYYFSNSEVVGYYGLQFPYYYPLLNNTQSTETITYDTAIDDTVLLSDIYDITTSKLRPPKCKYVYTYGYQLVFVQAISFWDFQNKETVYTNNDLIMYSDTSTGDLGENVSESNRQLIGNTYDGELAGGARSKDSFVAFKNRSIFFLDGVLIPGQYSLRKIETNEIGCVSEKSILSADGVVLFQGQDGLYGIDGYSCKKITTDLDPYFKALTDPSVTRSVMNNVEDQYIFWTSNGTVVFDYNYKKWFIWNSIDASCGLTVDNLGSIRMFSPENARRFTASLSDSGFAINAWIKSAWFDLGEPSLLKKATDIRFFSLNNQGQTLNLFYYMNWNEALFKGPFTADMTNTDIKTFHKNLDIIQHQSFSFEIGNSVVNEDLNLSGYEVSTTIIQTKDKNVK